MGLSLMRIRLRRKNESSRTRRERIEFCRTSGKSRELMPEFGNTEEGLAISDSQRKKQREVLEKTTGKNLTQTFAQANREALEAVSASYAPPSFVEPRCACCAGVFAQYRIWIERMVVQSYSYSAIAARIPADPETGKTLDRRSISRHAREHMRIEDTAARAMLEEEASLLKQNVDEGVIGAMTLRGSLKVLIQKAYRDAESGITTVEPKDMIQMIKLLHDLESNTSTTEAEEAKAAVSLFAKAIRNVAAKRRDESLMVEIRDEVQRLRQMDDMEGEIEENLVMPRLVGLPKPIDAEVIDEPDLPTS